MPDTQLAFVFDYEALDVDTRSYVQQRADEIRGLMKRAARDIIDIGQRLIEVKARLGHGQFVVWLESEFEWTDRTALNFMRVAERFKSEKFSDLLAPSALYLLAAPSTPDTAREEATERAAAGETITHKTAQEIVERHKNDRVNVVAEVRQRIAEGTPPEEAIAGVVEETRLPTPGEAKVLAQETGLMVAASDGYYHDGRSDVELAQVSAHSGRMYGVFRAIEALATVDVSAETFASLVRPDQAYRIANYLEAAQEWLSELGEVWSCR